MRPLTLKLKGFTSFRDEQELDFRNLDVFAVTGPTGAGKSSLLDAMTYALYGEVERVGRECGQLVSHGLTRMAVTLEFEVDRHEYRVTRSTPARTGPTKVLLERCVDGEWRSYGEGADRVREVNEYIRKLTGLDYAAFTRSVLLPQGKFAEFMVGKPDERRAIMSELLGLGLFKRMAQRAGRLASNADNAAKLKRDVLNSQFADVTPDALAMARQDAAESSHRLTALSDAAKAVTALSEEWRGEQLRVRELNACAADLRVWQTRLRTATETTAALSHQLENHAGALDNAAERVASTRQHADAAERERSETESRWGTAVDLAAGLATARRLPSLQGQVRDKQREVDAVVVRQPVNAALLTKASDVQRAAAESVAIAEAALESARQHGRDVEQANMAAALAGDLKIGDPCPVCGEPLEHLPVAPADTVVAAAQSAVHAAEKTLGGAQKSATAAEREVERIRRDIQEDERVIARFLAELAELRAAAEAAEREVSAALRGPASDGAAAVLSERMAALESLVVREKSTSADQAAALQLHTRVTSEVALVRERLLSQRDVLTDSADALVTRGLGLLDHSSPPPRWPASPSTDVAPALLLEFGQAKLGVLETFILELDQTASRSAAAESRLLESARHAIGDLLPPSPTLTATADALSLAVTQAVAHHAAAVQRTNSLSEALEKRAVLESEIAEHAAQATTYQALATDLRGDRLIAFLQDEALTTLAEAGSRHLFDLSGQRYELCVDRDFYVVDKWSADEKRSVRTLSGGETFLASLALALALSEQVRSLAVTERARLDSLFLDEGFGTLDPETLRTVVEAIEKLSGGGRLVGVITHVPELAEQFQRIEVEKSPTGSRLKLSI